MARDLSRTHDPVPGATLVALEGGGHELAEGDWDRLLGAILSRTAEG